MEESKKLNAKLIVVVRGGVVVTAYSNVNNISVSVLDYDELIETDASHEKNLENEIKTMFELEVVRP